MTRAGSELVSQSKGEMYLRSEGRGVLRVHGLYKDGQPLAVPTFPEGFVHLYCQLWQPFPSEPSVDGFFMEVSIRSMEEGKVLDTRGYLLHMLQEFRWLLLILVEHIISRTHRASCAAIKTKVHFAVRVSNCLSLPSRPHASSLFFCKRAF